MIVLPHELESGVESLLRRADSRLVARAAERLSQRYRGERVGGERFVTEPEDALAHAGWMLPAAFAQVSGALRMIPRRAAMWSPRSLLDLGAGPGTAAWAAASVWPALERVVAVEREPAFVSLGRELARASPHAAVRDAAWVARDLRDLELGGDRFDLVVLAHVAGELAAGDAGLLLREAWSACDGVLVVVEPGTPAGFERVESLRRALIAKGAHVLAPCPHDAACPLAESGRAEPPDWCHFAERVQRPGFQVRLKRAELAWEDAKFAFVAVARFPSAARPWARVIRHPRHAKGRVELDLCAQEGREARVVGRKAGDGWRVARKLDWGDAVDAADLGS